MYLCTPRSKRLRLKQLVNVQRIFILNLYEIRDLRDAAISSVSETLLMDADLSFKGQRLARDT